MKKQTKIIIMLLILLSSIVTLTSCRTINNVKETIDNPSSTDYSKDDKHSMLNTAEDFINKFGNKEFDKLPLEIPMTEAMQDFFLTTNIGTLHKKIIQGEFLGLIESNFIIKNNTPCVHVKVDGSKGTTEYDIFFTDSGEIQGFFLSNPLLHFNKRDSLITLFIAFFIITLFYFMPILSRKELFFGVRIPVENAEDIELTSIYSLYKKLILLIVAPVTLILIGVSYFNILIIPQYVPLIIVLLMIFGTYLVCHKKTKQIKSKKQWNIDKKQFVYVDTNYVSAKRKKVAVSSLWYIVPVLIILISSILIWINYESLPNSIAIHWGFFGEADNWIPKTPTAVMKVPILQLFVTILVFFGHLTICWSKQQIDTSDPETSMKKDRIFRRRISIFLLITVIYSTFTTSLFNLISLNIFEINSTITAVISISFFIVISCCGIYIAFFTGQGGSRLSLKSDKSNVSQSRNDDRFWKLGIFYVNRNDPSIFIEKRFGIGYTINFGNLLGIAIMILIIILILGSLIFF